MTNAPDPGEPSPWKSLGLFGIIIADLVVYPGLGYGFGRWMERVFALGQWSSVLGLLAGFALAFLQIYRISKRP